MDRLELEILDKILWAERCVKKHILLYNNIIDFNINNPDIPFKVKIYNYYNNIVSIPICKICTNQVKFYNGCYSVYCSNKCSNDDPDFKKIREESMIKKYGVKSLIGNKEVRDKIKATNLEKWGFDIASKSELVKNKVSNSKRNISADQKNEINKKRQNSTLQKYGVDNVSKSDDIKSKTIESNLNKWGYQFPIMSKEILEKRKNNYLEKTGKEHHFQFEDILKNMQVSRKKKMTEKYLLKLSNLNLDVKSYNDGNVDIICKNCNSEYNILIYVLYQRVSTNRTICINCNPLYNKTSSYQSEILSLLEENNIEYIKNDRTILDGKEIDIYMPNLNLAIEFNGLYWHSELYKKRYYHLDKTKFCEEKGINLIHIWEDDWRNKSDIIKSILLNRIGIISNRIYARNCQIREVSSDVSRVFLDNNHIQGFSASSLKLGLYYNNELVSLMTFGYRFTNSKKEYELIRFCNKIGFSVIGASSKLFKYFLNNFDFNRVISYSDISMFTGGMYEKLNFKYISTSEPNYFWIVNGVRRHRFNYNKKKLIKDGFDGAKTEVEIMHERGYYRIWGCGQKRWVYEKM